MARNMYGATSADFTLTSGGRPVPGAVLTIWSARTGGTQITDLLDVNSAACTAVTSAADGSVVYYGPNLDLSVHWADSGQGSRIAIRPVDITGEPPTLEIGTVTSGTADVSISGTSPAYTLDFVLPPVGADGVNTAAIQSSAVTTAKIASAAVTSVKIADDAVTAAKLASGSVGTSELVDSSVTTAKLATGAVTTTQIANGTISSIDLARHAVTTSKLANDAVVTRKLPLGVWVSTISWPQVAAHRLGKNHYGEETIRSAEMSVRAGIQVLECDFRMTSDGEIVLMHDATVDRTTNGTGTVSAMTGAQVAACRVDTYRSDDIKVSGLTPRRVATLDEVAAAFRGRAVIAADDKGLTSEQISEAAARWRQAGLLDTLIIQSWSDWVSEQWADEGFTTLYLPPTDLPEPAATKAAGIDWVGYAFTGTGTAGELSRITAAKSAGLKVATFTHASYEEHAAALAAGSDMLMSDHPGIGLGLEYLDVHDGLIHPGILPHYTNDYWSVADQVLRYNNSITWASAEVYAELAGLGPTTTELTFDLSWRHVGGTVAVDSVWSSLYLSDTPQQYKATSNGYHILVRMTGQVAIYKWDGSAAAMLGNMTGDALAGSTDYTLRVQVTDTQVIATCNGVTSTATDATYRPAGGWWPTWARNVKEIGFLSAEWTA